MEVDEGTVTLISSDGDHFCVPIDAAKVSGFVKDAMTNEDDEDVSVSKISLEFVNSQVLEKVIEFCKLYVEKGEPTIAKPLKSTVMADNVVQEEYANFINLGPEQQELVFQLILAANRLFIDSLLELALAKVSTWIKDKKPAEIRRIFKIQNDFTGDEVQRILGGDGLVGGIEE